MIRPQASGFDTNRQYLGQKSQSRESVPSSLFLSFSPSFTQFDSLYNFNIYFKHLYTFIVRQKVGFLPRNNVLFSFTSTQIPNTVVVVHITNVRHNSDNYKTDVTDLCQRHISKQQVTVQRFLNASSALILAMNFDNFITLFYLTVTNPPAHLNALWYSTALYTELHNCSDPPYTQKYLMVLIA